jgi:hypothetical protein
VGAGDLTKLWLLRLAFDTAGSPPRHDGRHLHPTTYTPRKEVSPVRQTENFDGGDDGRGDDGRGDNDGGRHDR